MEWAAGIRSKDCSDCYRLMGNVQASWASRVSRPEGQASQPEALLRPARLPNRRHRIAGIVTPGRGDDVNGVQPKASKSSTFLNCSDEDLSASLLPSAKTTVIKDIILDWRRRYPTDKVISELSPYPSPVGSTLTTSRVFTEFVVMGRLLGRMLQDAGMGFLYYFGSMSHTEKTKAVADFTNKENIHVLVSLPLPIFLLPPTDTPGPHRSAPSAAAARPST